MYTVIYLYRVDKEKIQSFLDSSDRISEIFLDNGALEDEIYEAEDLEGKNGCKGLLDLVEVTNNEQVFLGQSVFRNKSHYEEVLTDVNNHDEAIQLMNTLKQCVDYTKTFTGTFSTPD